MALNEQKAQEWLRDLAQRIENHRGGWSAHAHLTQQDVDQLRDTAAWFDTYDERVADGSVETEE